MQGRDYVSKEDLQTAINLVILPRALLKDQQDQQDQQPQEPPPPPPPPPPQDQQEDQEEEEQEDEEEQDEEDDKQDDEVSSLYKLRLGCHVLTAQLALVSPLCVCHDNVDCHGLDAMHAQIQTGLPKSS